MPASLVSSEIELPADVVQLAAKLGVTAYLPQVLDMTRAVFPMLGWRSKPTKTTS